MIRDPELGRAPTDPVVVLILLLILAICRAGR